MKSKSIRTKLVILSGSMLLSFVLAEVGYRVALFSDLSVFAGIREPHFYADYFSEDDHWKLYYRFGGQFDPPENPHPLLGWIGDFSRETLVHNKTKHLDGRRPVLLYGDSFAQCSSGALCFQDILNEDARFSKGHYLLNYGVGGYATDQILLLFQNSVGSYDDPFVVISLMTLDLDRSILSVRVGQKPFFRVEENTLRLHGTPINPDAHEFFAQNPPQIACYLCRRLLYGKFLPPQLTSFLKREDEHTQRKMQVNEKLILEIARELEARRIDHVFLVFHPHWPGVSAMDGTDWRDSFLKRLFEENDIPHIWSKELVMENTAGTLRVDEYFLPNDGHPTTHYNRLLSAEIKKHVLEKSHETAENWVSDRSDRRDPSR